MNKIFCFVLLFIWKNFPKNRTHITIRILKIKAFVNCFCYIISKKWGLQVEMTIKVLIEFKPMRFICKKSKFNSLVIILIDNLN